MKIKMRTHYAGPAGNFPPGSVRECEDREAEALVDGGYAELVLDEVSEPEEPEQIERAEIVPPEAETSVPKRPRKKP